MPTAEPTTVQPQRLEAAVRPESTQDVSETKSFISSSDQHHNHHVLLSPGAAPSYHPEASTTTLAHSLNPIMLGYDPHNGGMRTLAVDGADDDRAITFSAAGHEKKTVYHLSPPRAPDTADFPIEVQGLVEDVELVDVISGQHFYTIRSDRDCKNFTIIPEFGVDTNIIMRPTRSLATYRCECEGPNGTTWIWKGNIYKNMELFEKNKRGEKKIVAIYVRTSTRSHQLRVYKDLVPSDQPIYSSPTLALAIATLYPFLALYRQALEKDFTSDRKVLQKAAGAQPSGWDAKFMGSDPAMKKKKKLAGDESPPSASANGGTASNGQGNARDDRSIRTTTRRRWLPWNKD